jgi:hypothetical protein
MLETYPNEIRKTAVKKAISENCSSLVRCNNRFFISRADVVKIFGTRSDYLSKIAQKAQQSRHPLIKGQDYETFVDGGLYFSLSGIYKLSLVFKESIAAKDRKSWCSDVGDTIHSHVKNIINQKNVHVPRRSSVL